MSSLVDDDEDWQERLESLFNERGRWRDSERQLDWPSPGHSMANREFRVVFETCLDVLLSKVFMIASFLASIRTRFEMEASFLAVWYVLGILMPTGVGALLGRRLLRW